MKRGLSLLALGIAVGCGGTLLIDRWFFDSTTYSANSDRWRKALEPQGTGVVESRLPELLSGTGSVAERSAIALIAARTGAEGIRERILEVVASPPSARRRFALELLISRYAELDPGAAANLVHELDLEDSLLARVFGVWAELDDEGAIAALRQEIDADRAVAVALAIAATLGNDEQAARRVAAALPPAADDGRFQVELIGQVAETAPERAMRMAVALEEPDARSRALARVAHAWAEADPAGALAQAGRIDNARERQQFLGQVGRHWARSDPDAVLRLLEANGNDPDMRTLLQFAAPALAESRPRESLALAGSLEPQAAFNLRSAALRSIASTDPQAAIVLLGEIPASEYRRHILQGVAQAYARKDADAALAWAQSLPEHERSESLSAVLGVIAGDHPGRAIEHALTLEDARDRGRAIQHIAMQALHSSDNARDIGRRLLAIEQDDIRGQALDAFASMWASRDPEAALDWMLANESATNTGAFQRAARQIAQHDPRAALQMANRLPAELRDEWIAQAAASFARADPQGAMTWLQQNQGQPHFEASLAAIALHATAIDPRAVTQLVPSMEDGSHALTVATAAASHWGRREPRAAANWALELADDQLRSAAVAGVASQWAGSDSAAAERWVLSLSAGPLRDNALRAVISSAARNSRPLEPLFDAFSTDSSREEAARLAVFAIARRDMQEAQAFLDRHVSDEAMRQRLEQQIARYGRSY